MAKGKKGRNGKGRGGRGINENGGGGFAPIAALVLPKCQLKIACKFGSQWIYDIIECDTCKKELFQNEFCAAYTVTYKLVHITNEHYTNTLLIFNMVDKISTSTSSETLCLYASCDLVD